jgi:hypothetical protein
MGWGTLTIGRTTLREDYTASYRVNMNTGQQTLALTGLEWASGMVTPAHVRARREDIMTMQGAILPVTFSKKEDHTGFYRVVDAGVDHTAWDEADHFRWNLSLEKIGVATAVDIESRLTGIARANDHGPLAGELWHAPAIGHTGYDTGSTSPASTVARVTPEGTVTVYRGIPANTDPRWAILPTLYGGGRVRVLMDGIERMGTGFKTSTSWEMSNGLVRVTSSGGLLVVSAYDGASWESKVWNVQVGSNLTGFDEVTVIRNDYEACTVRLYRAQSVSGRIYVDLSLRRGSRFIEGYIQVSTSNTLGLSLQTIEASTSATGYVVANADDAAGNRAIVGSARSFTADTDGGLSKAATRTLDFFVGAVVGGSSAIPGDTAVNLRDQYIGALAEATMVVKR